MTNPFIEVAKGKSGNPFLDLVQGRGSSVDAGDNPFAVAPRAPDNPFIQSALSFAQGALSTPQGILHTANRLIESETLKNVSHRLDQFAAAYSPVIDESNDSTLAKVGRVAGNFIGSAASAAPVFKAASGLVKGVGMAGEALAPNLTSRILSRISNAGRYAEQLALQSPRLSNYAGKIGQTVAALPGELTAGTLTQAAIDPESLATPKGVAMSVGLGTAGAFLGAKNQLIGDKLLDIDNSLPIYQQNLLRAKSAGEQVRAPDIKNLGDRVRTNLIDRFNPLLQKENLGSQEFYDTAVRHTNGTGAMVNQFNDTPLKLDPVTNTYVPTGNMGINQIEKEFIKTVRDKADYDALLIAQRQLDLSDRGIRLGNFSDADANLMIQNAPAHIKDAVQRTHQALADLRNFVNERGVITDNNAAGLALNNPNYAPMLRQVIEKVNPGFFREDSFGVGNPIKKIKGITSQDTLGIRDPIQNIKDLNHILLKIADRNELGQKIFNEVRADPKFAREQGIHILSGQDKYRNPEFYSKLSGIKDILNTHDVPAAMQSYFKGLNTQGAQSGSLPQWYTDKLAEDVVGLFGRSFNPTDKILTVRTAQGPFQVQLNDGLAKMYETLSPKQMNAAFQFAGNVAHTLKTGTTANPVFGFINSIRDSFDATINSQYGFRFGVDSWKGFLESIEKGKYAGKMRQEWMANGGGFSSLNKIGANPTTVPGQSALTNVVLHPIEALKQLTRPFEEAARLGEYIKGREQGASAIEAALASRKVTVDFAQQGGAAYMQALNQMTAFLNPGIQSLDNNYQRFINGDSKSALMKGFAAISAPSALIWLANQNDQEIQDLRKTPQGATSWFVRLPEGHIARIPKPFLYGQIFGTGMETALDNVKSLIQQGKLDPSTLDGFASALKDQALFNAVPNIISLPAQVWANKDQFTGSAIVPESMSGLDPQAQVLNSTSAFAKNVSTYINGASGGKVNVSPIYIDWLTRNVGGSLARDVTNIPSTGVDREIGELPFFRRFFAVTGSSNTEPMQTFYRESDKMAEVLKTAQLYEKTGKTEKFYKYLDEHRDEFAKATYYAETRKQLSTLRNTIEQIHDGPFSPEQKKEYIKYLTQQAIEIARGVNVAVGQ